VKRKRLGRGGAERLGAIEPFRELSIGQRRMLAALVDEATAAAGETLMLEGEPGYEVLILEHGSADVLQGGECINVMGPGDLFGELAVLEDGEPRTASVIATSDVRAFVLTAHFTREVRDRIPAVGETIERMAAERRSRDRVRGSTAE